MRLYKQIHIKVEIKNPHLGTANRLHRLLSIELSADWRSIATARNSDGATVTMEVVED